MTPELFTTEKMLSTGGVLGRGRLLSFIGEFANHPCTVGEGIEKGIAPSGGEDGCCLLIDVLVGLGEETSKLTAGRGDEFFDGDEETNLGATLAFFEGKKMKKRKLFGNILLGKFPIAHKFLRRQRQEATM